MFTTHKRQATQKSDPVCAASAGVHKPRSLKEAGPGCWPHRHSSVWFYSPSHAVWKPEAGPTFIGGLKVFLARFWCTADCTVGRGTPIRFAVLRPTPGHCRLRWEEMLPSDLLDEELPTPQRKLNVSCLYSTAELAKQLWQTQSPHGVTRC